MEEAFPCQMRHIWGHIHPCFLGTLSPNPWHFSLWANGMIDKERQCSPRVRKTIARLRLTLLLGVEARWFFSSASTVHRNP